MIDFIVRKTERIKTKGQPLIGIVIFTPRKNDEIGKICAFWKNHEIMTEVYQIDSYSSEKELMEWMDNLAVDSVVVYDRCFKRKDFIYMDDGAKAVEKVRKKYQQIVNATGDRYLREGMEKMNNQEGPAQQYCAYMLGHIFGKKVKDEYCARKKIVPLDLYK